MFLLSCTPVTLNQGYRQFDKYQNVQFNSIYHSTKFEPNRFLNIWIHYMPMVKSSMQQSPPLLHQILLKSSIRMLTWIALTLYKISSWSAESLGENETKRFCFALTLGHPAMVKVTEKWYKMVEFDDAYRHGRYDKIWSKSLCVMSCINAFATRQPAGIYKWISYITGCNE